MLKVLSRAEPPALFATDLAVRVQDVGDGFTATLGSLASQGSVLVTQPPLPDPHLASLDLRIVALVPSDGSSDAATEAALRATQTVWDRWLREFLAGHRCQ